MPHCKREKSRELNQDGAQQTQIKDTSPRFPQSELSSNPVIPPRSELGPSPGWTQSSRWPMPLGSMSMTSTLCPLPTSARGVLRLKSSPAPTPSFPTEALVFAPTTSRPSRTGMARSSGKTVPFPIAQPRSIRHGTFHAFLNRSTGAERGLQFVPPMDSGLHPVVRPEPVTDQSMDGMPGSPRPSPARSGWGWMVAKSSFQAPPVPVWPFPSGLIS